MSNKLSKDRVSLCTFTFADGRRCRSPRSGTKYDLCFFHLVKLRQRRAAEQAGEDVAAPFDTDFSTACDLNAALTRLFSAVAQGLIKPKVASTLANIGQLLIRNQPLAKQEILAAGGQRVWTKFVRNSVTPPALEDSSDDNSDSEDEPDSEDDSGSEEEAEANDELPSSDAPCVPALTFPPSH
jgi:hypothetical protein